MSTYNTTLLWHQNTSKAGKRETLAESVTLKEAKDALMDRIDRHDNAVADFQAGTIHDAQYSPSEIWRRGDGSLKYGDFTIEIEEA